MKKILCLGIISLLSGVLPSSAFIKEYFNTFYYDYLNYRNIKSEDMEIFDILHKISNDKVYWLDKSLNSDNDDKDIIINLIDEEFFDLKENLDFEAGYVENKPLSKGWEKKIKKAHKKFMRQIRKCYCLR